MEAAEYEPTDTVWGSLIVACGQAGHLQSALNLWHAFKNAKGGLGNVKNPEPCMAMLIACGQTYQLQPALTVLSEMKQAGMHISHPRPGISRNTRFTAKPEARCAHASQASIKAMLVSLLYDVACHDYDTKWIRRTAEAQKLALYVLCRQ